MVVRSKRNSRMQHRGTRSRNSRIISKKARRAREISSKIRVESSRQRQVVELQAVQSYSKNTLKMLVATK